MPKVVPSQVVEVIDKIFPTVKNQKDSQHNSFSIDRAYKNEVAAIVHLVDQIPAELLILDPEDYTALQLAVTAIKTTIDSWQIRDYGLENIHGYGNLNPVTIIRNALSKCPDEGTSKSTSNLTFISDQELRDSLRIDISSANQAFQNGEWKAATVLAGATIEALLLYVLHMVQTSDSSKIETSIKSLVSKNTLNKATGNNLDNWSLHPLIEVSADIRLIKEETATQTRIARDFRNLIHPGVSVRKKIVCNRGTALSALAGLEHVINDLSTFAE
jgi:hypothetical protein